MTQRLLPLAFGLSLAVAPLVAHADETATLHDIARSAQETEAAAAPAAENEAPAAPAPASPRSRRDRATVEVAAAAGVRNVIARKAAEHGVPAGLADAVARLESRYNPRAAHAGNFGLMQIRLQTARGEGYSGSAQGLLDTETNAHFGIKHLARAYRMANGDTCGTIMRYQSGLRATRMNGANRAYCAKVKSLMGSPRVASAS